MPIKVRVLNLLMKQSEPRLLPAMARLLGSFNLNCNQLLGQGYENTALSPEQWLVLVDAAVVLAPTRPDAIEPVVDGLIRRGRLPMAIKSSKWSLTEWCPTIDSCPLLSVLAPA